MERRRVERREVALADDPETLARLVRILGASVNVAILRALEAERKNKVTDGWLFLSEIAERLGESPGTVVQAVEKLMPFLEERRERGRRYFRTRVRELRLAFTLDPAESLL